MAGPMQPDPSAIRPKVGVAVVAAGESRRMGGIDKMFVSLGGLPLLTHCLKTFNDSPSVDAIVIATSRHNIENVERLVSNSGMTKVERLVEGGARRRDSVLSALQALRGNDIVLVHDGARPFVDEPTIERAVSAALESGAASVAVPVKDTIKVSNPDMSVKETPPRDSLWAAQTPQAFEYGLIVKAHTRIQHDTTDDAAMIEAIGHPVKLVMGSYDNIKVTTPEDLYIAEAILRSREGDDAN